MSNLIEFVEADGFALKKTAMTNGGEYHSPCPWCGGNDRFAVWPKQKEYGKYWCRQCDRSGDAIQYLMDCRSMSFKEAADLVGKQLDNNFTKTSPKKQQVKNLMNQKPKFKEKPQPPSTAWSDKVKGLVEVTHNYLINDEALVERLHKERGLTLETIKFHKLGVNDRKKYRKRKEWGLSEELNDKGKPKKLYFPPGLIIPHFCRETGKPLSIRIRRSDPDEYGKFGKYYVLPGSSSQPMIINQIKPWPETDPVIVIESELDGVLLAQEANNPFTFISMGSAQIKPSDELAEILSHAPFIFVALDSDEAGGKQSVNYWQRRFLNAVRMPIPRQLGKDPCEAHLNGLDLNLWISAAYELVIDLGGELITKPCSKEELTHERC